MVLYKMRLDVYIFSLHPQTVYLQSCHWAFGGEVIGSVAPVLDAMFALK